MSAQRLLIVNGAAVADVSEVPAHARELLDGASDVFVVTPVLAANAQGLASDPDRARRAARERLDAVLRHVSALDVPAEGRVADGSPLVALEDAVRKFRPDNILVALQSFEHADRQERGLVEAVRGRFRLPLTIFEIDPQGRVPGHGA